MPAQGVEGWIFMLRSDGVFTTAFVKTWQSLSALIRLKSDIACAAAARLADPFARWKHLLMSNWKSACFATVSSAKRASTFDVHSMFASCLLVL